MAGSGGYGLTSPGAPQRGGRAAAPTTTTTAAFKPSPGNAPPSPFAISSGAPPPGGGTAGLSPGSGPSRGARQVPPAAPWSDATSVVGDLSLEPLPPGLHPESKVDMTAALPPGLVLEPCADEVCATLEEVMRDILAVTAQVG